MGTRVTRGAWLAFAGIVTLLCLGYLVGPRVGDADQGAQCVGNVDLPGPFGLGLNCDAPVFMSLAREPSQLLALDCTRQSRPGLIAMAALLHVPLSRFADPDRRVERFTYRWNGTPSYVSDSFEVDTPAFVAYVILNALMLLAVFACLRGTIRRYLRADAASAVLVVALGVLLVANDVSKAFFWAPHTQLLNILGPVFSVYASVRVLEGALVRLRFALGLGLALGIGMTVYGIFAIALPAIGVAALVASRRARSWRVAARTLGNYALVVVLTGLPSLAWYRYVVAETGQFFNMELRMGHVVWMRDAWEVGPRHFATEWLENLAELVALAAPQAIPAAALALVVITVALAARELGPTLRRARDAVALSLLVCALAGAFYASVGFINARLGFAMVPGLVIVGGVAAFAAAAGLDRRRRWALAIAALSLALGVAVFSVVKDGPYS